MREIKPAHIIQKLFIEPLLYADLVQGPEDAAGSRTDMALSLRSPQYTEGQAHKLVMQYSAVVRSTVLKPDCLGPKIPSFATEASYFSLRALICFHIKWDS